MLQASDKGYKLEADACNCQWDSINYDVLYKPIDSAECITTHITINVSWPTEAADENAVQKVQCCVRYLVSKSFHVKDSE